MKITGVIVLILCSFLNVLAESPHLCKLCVCECELFEDKHGINDVTLYEQHAFQEIFFNHISSENNLYQSCKTLSLKPEELVLHIDCSSENNVGQTKNLNWTAPKIPYIYGNFKNSKWTNFDQFPNDIKRKLIKLSLSENFVSNPTKGFDGFLQLQVLNISFNSLQRIDSNLFSKLGSLLKLDISNNHIKEIDPFSFMTNKELLYLDLSTNEISALEENTFHGCKNLKVLDLSYNPITKLSLKIFQFTSSLLHLSMSNTELKELPQLPTLLLSLDISNNYIDISQTNITLPQNITSLDVSYNAIEDISPLLSLHKLKFLNCAGNPIQTENYTLQSDLEELDISYSGLQKIPAFISPETIPLLKKLILDGNNITSLKKRPGGAHFRQLTYMSLSHLPFLKEILESSLQGMLPDSEGIDCKKNEGVALKITKNPKLSRIDSSVFNTLNLCEVDLSGNALESIPSDLLKWSELRRIDLQDNPWNCECSNQWMLDELVPLFYDRSQSLLYNLRCASPPKLANKRFAYWYNRTERMFCGRKEPSAYTKAGFGSNIAYLIIGISICCLLLLITAGLLWDTKIRKNKRFRNRRF